MTRMVLFMMLVWLDVFVSSQLRSRKLEMIESLFPHRNHSRELYGLKVKNSITDCPNSKTQKNPASVTCVKCAALNYCSILNGYMVQEVYYPDNPELRGTCNVIESLGERIFDNAFGIGRSFRDTPACREIVMGYLCLFWGTDNAMYTNCCINQESVSQTGIPNIVERAPCRSYCIQVAQTCAYDEDFLQLCADIPCPPTADTCTSDPTVDGQSLDANVGCNIPLHPSPYAPKLNSAPGSRMGNLGSLATALIIALIVAFMLE